MVTAYVWQLISLALKMQIATKGDIATHIMRPFVPLWQGGDSGSRYLPGSLVRPGGDTSQKSIVVFGPPGGDALNVSPRVLLSIGRASECSRNGDAGE